MNVSFKSTFIIPKQDLTETQINHIKDWIAYGIFNPDISTNDNELRFSDGYYSSTDVGAGDASKVGFLRAIGVTKYAVIAGQDDSKDAEKINVFIGDKPMIANKKNKSESSDNAKAENTNEKVNILSKLPKLPRLPKLGKKGGENE